MGHHKHGLLGLSSAAPTFVERAIYIRRARADGVKGALSREVRDQSRVTEIKQELDSSTWGL